MKIVPWILLATVGVSKPAFSTLGIIYSPHKISIWSEAAPYFDEVNATLQTNRNKEDNRMKSIVLRVKGKRLSVPKEDLKDITFPLLNTAKFSTYAGPDTQSPLLYLEFQFIKRNGDLVTYQRARVPFTDGKIKPIQIFRSEKIG